MGQDTWVDIKRLVRGDKAAWDVFVERFSPVIYSAVRRTFPATDRGSEDILDVAQNVFMRLCKDNYHLLKSYDPARASLVTWLTLIARSAAIDFLRRRTEVVLPDEALVDITAVQEPSSDSLIIPPDLLSPRQKLVMHLLYNRGMDVSSVAEVLRVDAQTVRSTRHKALLKLRKHLSNEV